MAQAYPAGPTMDAPPSASNLARVVVARSSAVRGCEAVNVLGEGGGGAWVTAKPPLQSVTMWLRADAGEGGVATAVSWTCMGAHSTNPARVLLQASADEAGLDAAGSDGEVLKGEPRAGEQLHRLRRPIDVAATPYVRFTVLETFGGAQVFLTGISLRAAPPGGGAPLPGGAVRAPAAAQPRSPTGKVLSRERSWTGGSTASTASFDGSRSRADLLAVDDAELEASGLAEDAAAGVHDADVSAVLGMSAVLVADSFGDADDSAASRTVSESALLDIEERTAQGFQLAAPQPEAASWTDLSSADAGVVASSSPVGRAGSGAPRRGGRAGDSNATGKRSDGSGGEGEDGKGRGADTDAESSSSESGPDVSRETASLRAVLFSDVVDADDVDGGAATLSETEPFGVDETRDVGFTLSRHAGDTLFSSVADELTHGGGSSSAPRATASDDSSDESERDFADVLFGGASAGDAGDDGDGGAATLSDHEPDEELRGGAGESKGDSDGGSTSGSGSSAASSDSFDMLVSAASGEEEAPGALPPMDLNRVGPTGYSVPGVRDLSSVLQDMALEVDRVAQRIGGRGGGLPPLPLSSPPQSHTAALGAAAAPAVAAPAPYEGGDPAGGAAGPFRSSYAQEAYLRAVSESTSTAEQLRARLREKLALRSRIQAMLEQAEAASDAALGGGSATQRIDPRGSTLHDIAHSRAAAASQATAAAWFSPAKT